MAASWQRRLAYAVQRRWRILQGIGRFYGGKLRDGARLVLRSRTGRAVVLVTVVAGAVVLGLIRMPGMPLTRGGGGLPIVSGLDAHIHQATGPQLADRHQLTLAQPTAAGGGRTGGATAVPVATAGRAGATAQPAVAADALPGPAVPAAQAARPRADLRELAPPVDGPVVAEPGWRRHPAFGHWYYDPGVRVAAVPGGPVRAVLPGTVVEAGPDPDGGFRVAIDHGEGVITVYGSLDHVLVPVGQHVSAHAPVGLAATVPDEAAVRFAVYVEGEPVDPQGVLALP
ncbi:MAG TPA: M23 family metallopeptidase [Limnochordales bacterium]